MDDTRAYLVDLHVHSTFSDGAMTIAELVDFYGSRGFGAIAITDHIAESKTLIGKASVHLNQVMTPETYPEYLAQIREEGARSWDQYKMLVIPGFELSKNSISNSRSAHILGLGVTEFLPADGDAFELIQKIKAQGGLAIAAHPVHTKKFEKQTFHLWNRRRELAQHFDAWEVASGRFLFDEVLGTRLPKVASSDLHTPRHVNAWKTQLDCEKHPGAIFRAIRKQQLRIKFYKDPSQSLA